MMSTPLQFTRGSGNVFADLGLPESDLLLAKTDVAITITRILRERGLKQTAAARLLGIDQPKVSAITRGRLDDFSLERLMLLANRLGQDVEISIVPNPQPELQGRLTIRTDQSQSVSREPAEARSRATATDFVNRHGLRQHAGEGETAEPFHEERTADSTDLVKELFEELMGSSSGSHQQHRAPDSMATLLDNLLTPNSEREGAKSKDNPRSSASAKTQGKAKSR